MSDRTDRRGLPLWVWLIFAFFVVAAFADHYAWPWWVQGAGQAGCIARFAALASRRRRRDDR